MPTSVRLDDRTRRLLRRLVRSKNKTQSEIIRDAIEALAEAAAVGTEQSPFARVEDLIGCVHGGPPDLSEQTGEKFTALLIEQARRRDEG